MLRGAINCNFSSSPSYLLAEWDNHEDFKYGKYLWRWHRQVCLMELTKINVQVGRRVQFWCMSLHTVMRILMADIDIFLLMVEGSSSPRIRMLKELSGSRWYV
jgi:hypothetical protein